MKDILSKRTRIPGRRKKKSKHNRDPYWSGGTDTSTDDDTDHNSEVDISCLHRKQHRTGNLPTPEEPKLACFSVPPLPHHLRRMLPPASVYIPRDKDTNLSSDDESDYLKPMSSPLPDSSTDGRDPHSTLESQIPQCLDFKPDNAPPTAGHHLAELPVGRIAPLTPSQTVSKSTRQEDSDSTPQTDGSQIARPSNRSAPSVPPQMVSPTRHAISDRTPHTDDSATGSQLIGAPNRSPPSVPTKTVLPRRQEAEQDAANRAPPQTGSSAAATKLVGAPNRSPPSVPSQTILPMRQEASDRTPQTGGSAAAATKLGRPSDNRPSYATHSSVPTSPTDPVGNPEKPSSHQVWHESKNRPELHEAGCK